MTLSAKIGIALLAIVLTSGCTSTMAGEQERKQADAIAEKAAANERALRESAKKALDDRLNELDHRIAALRADAKPATKKAKTDLDHEIARLQSEAADLRAKLSTDAGRTETWDKVKRATEETLDKLERKLNDLSPKK